MARSLTAFFDKIRAYSHYLPVIAVGIAGCLVSVGAFLLVNNNHDARTTQNFQAVAHERVQTMNQELEENIALLHSVAAFFHGSADVSSAEFNSLVKQLMKDYPRVYAVQWVPLVKARDRAAFEKQAQQIHPGFRIKEFKGSANIPQLDQRNFFLPIFYIRPVDGNEILIGFDMLSEATRRQVTRRARDSGEIAVSGALPIPGEARVGEKSVRVVAPVYNRTIVDGEIILGTIKGFIIVLLPMRDFVQGALAPLSPAGVDLIMRDKSAPLNNQILYVAPSRLHSDNVEQVLAREDSTSLSYTESVNFGGRLWEYTFIPAPGYFVLTPPLSAVISLVMGLLLTATIIGYLLMQATQSVRVKKLVQEHTHELQLAKLRIESLLRSTSDGILGLDSKGRITLANPHALSLLQYGEDELLGHGHHTLIHHSHEDGRHFAAHECPIEKCLRDGVAVKDSDDVFWRKDGTPLSVEYTCAPLIEGDQTVGLVVAFRDISQRKLSQEKLRHLAQYDQLTGLANRTLFLEHLNKSITRAKRDGSKVGVIYIDLDGFKPVNDSLGHAAGDELLRLFALRLKEAVREYDVAARIGGDEFTVLADGVASAAECKAVADRIAAAGNLPFPVLGHTVHISTSIGMAVFPEDARNLDELLADADRKMYAAKKSHKKNKRPSGVGDSLH